MKWVLNLAIAALGFGACYIAWGGIFGPEWLDFGPYYWRIWVPAIMLFLITVIQGMVNELKKREDES
ncbi:hypothetical protein M1N56_06065 [Dehalococcoidia bacterium]|nr:hypothetical protein [Dehalococcoidia bacterium]